MRVSGKITHSFYCFLKARGFDVSRLFELTSLEMEFLKDTSQWIDLDQVESLINKLDKEYSLHFVDQDFLISVGHSCFELGAWGELDSVLKMRKDAPVFSNLPVFMSYFISDGFSLITDRNESGFMSFKCNLSSEEYPCVTEYLRATLESLPVYANKDRAEVKWIRDYIQIKWEEDTHQVSLFAPHSEVNIKPELLTDLRYFLEKVEKELYHQRQQIVEKNQEIRKLKDQMLMQGISSSGEVKPLIQKMEQELLHLKDFLSSKDNEQNRDEQLISSFNHLLEMFDQVKNSI